MVDFSCLLIFVLTYIEITCLLQIYVETNLPLLFTYHRVYNSAMHKYFLKIGERIEKVLSFLCLDLLRQIQFKTILAYYFPFIKSR